MYELIFSVPCARKFKKMDQTTKRRIADFIEQKLAVDPKKYSIQLVNCDNIFRARIGDYRIVFEIRKQQLTIIIIDIDHRSKIYQ